MIVSEGCRGFHHCPIGAKRHAVVANMLRILQLVWIVMVIEVIPPAFTLDQPTNYTTVHKRTKVLITSMRAFKSITPFGNRLHNSGPHTPKGQKSQSATSRMIFAHNLIPLVLRVVQLNDKCEGLKSQ